MSTEPNEKSEIDIIIALIASQRLADAENMADTLIQRQPMLPKAWFLKGMSQKMQGNNSGAIKSFNQTLKYQPDFMEACSEMAHALEIEGKTTLAIKTYEHFYKIIQTGGKKPELVASKATADALENAFQKGNKAFTEQRLEDAVAAYREACEIYHDAPGALLNLGITLYKLGRNKEAITALLQCLRVKTHDADTLNAIGNCYMADLEYVRAAAAYHQSTAENPNYAKAWMNLGKSYFFMRDFPNALEAYKRSIALSPDNADASTELTHVLYGLCYLDEAEGVRQKTLEILKKDPVGSPFTVAVHMQEMEKENTVGWLNFHTGDHKPYNANLPLPQTIRGDKKLRIGYLSSDLNYHATAFLINDLFKLHDRSKFEVYAYSYSKYDNSEETRQIKKSVDHFHDILPLNTTQAVNQIQSDGIDILVDLKGHTQGVRLGVIAQRPAPIQMHYLGYPGTFGADSIDYIIADPYTAPEGSDSQFTEAVIRLPHCYQMNSQSRNVPLESPSRAEYGLPDDALVFADFNNSYKYTAAMFATWMNILKAVPGSILWLYESRQEATRNLINLATKHGVDPARLYFATALPVKEHLKRYLHVDLVLDTAPVGGHTTTSDALWSGAPVLVMKGERFISRVGESLLTNAKLPELVASNLAHYEKIAIELATNREKLARMRKHLEENRHKLPLFDAAATTRAIEAAYLRAATMHREGRAPEGFWLKDSDIQ